MIMNDNAFTCRFQCFMVFTVEFIFASTTTCCHCFVVDVVLPFRFGTCLQNLTYNYVCVNLLMAIIGAQTDKLLKTRVTGGIELVEGLREGLEKG